MKLRSLLAMWATLLSGPAWAGDQAMPAAVLSDEVVFQDLPRPAQAALLAFRRQAASAPYACYGMSEKQFEQAIGVLVQTDYNGDGRPDFLFASPCRPPEPSDGRLPPGTIVLSGPLSYTVSQRFSASLGRVGSQRALLVDAACDEADRGYEGPCYLGRIWDPQRRAWSDVTPVRLGPDGGLRAAPRPSPVKPQPKIAEVAKSTLPPLDTTAAPAHVLRTPLKRTPTKTAHAPPPRAAEIAAPLPAATPAPNTLPSTKASEAALAPAPPVKPSLPKPTSATPSGLARSLKTPPDAAGARTVSSGSSADGSTAPGR